MNEKFEKLTKELISLSDNNITLLLNVLEYSPMGVNIILEDGTCIFENQSMKEIIGDFEEKALGANIFNLSSIKDAGLVEHYKRCLEGEIVKLKNFTFKSSLTGKELLLDLALIPIINSNQKAVITLYYDTLRFAKGMLEKKIRSLEMERDFSYTLLNNAPIAIFAFDKNGTIFSANNALGKIFGNKKIDILGRNIFDTDDIIPNRLMEIFRRAIKGVPYEGELQVYLKKIDKDFMLDLVITPIYDDEENIESVLVMFSDVTEKVRIRKALQDDLALARKIQSTIISDNYKNEIDELKFFIHYQPMGEVGGDFYDIAKLMPSDIIRIFVTDATGHGVQGALTTMLIKSEYEKVKIFDLPANKVLEIVNNNFVSLYPNLNIYFTCFIADIDLNENVLRYSSAGHPEQFLLREDKVFRLKGRGKYLGIFEKSEYQLMEMPIQQGDRLFLFTDGLYEEFSDADEIFGEENLMNVIMENRNNDLTKHGHSIITDVFGFKGWRAISDDITFIAAEIL